MAIGDTVNAGLMRVDFSPIARAGQAQARANQAFGDAIGGVIDKFYQKKKDKQEREEREQAYLKMGLSDEEAKAASRDKDLANQFINKINADRNYTLEMNKFNQAGELRDLQMQQIRQNMERQKDADQLVEKERISKNQFLQTLPSLITNPELQRQADIAMPGLSALGNADTRNRFMQSRLDDPENQVPVMNLKDRDFLNQFKDDPQQFERALAFIEKRRANQPKPMSDKDKIDLINKQETTRQLYDKPLIDLGDKFDKNKQVQKYKAVKVSYDTISLAAENPSAAGDLSLIFQYMKVLDPGSTVREGEFANAQNAAGVPARIRNLFNNWAEGQRLNDDQRQDFVKQAKKIVDARRKSIDPIIKQTRQKFDRQIRSQNRDLSPEESDLLFQEVIFPDIKSPNNEKNQNTSPQITAPQSVNLNSGGIFTPVQ